MARRASPHLKELRELGVATHTCNADTGSRACWAAGLAPDSVQDHPKGMRQSDRRGNLMSSCDFHVGMYTGPYNTHAHTHTTN